MMPAKAFILMHTSRLSVLPGAEHAQTISSRPCVNSAKSRCAGLYLSPKTSALTRITLAPATSAYPLTSFSSREIKGETKTGPLVAA